MRVPTRPLARASPFPTAMSLDDAHAAFVELPPCSKSIVVGAVVVGLILNPIFGIDDLVAFCPLDVLRRGQFHRLLTSALHVDGPIATVACCVVAVRIIAPWERHRGTLRAAFDGAAATLFVNVASIAFAVLAAPFAPNVFKPNFLGDSGALVATFTVFVRETTRAPANVDAAAHFGGTISAKRAPTAAAVVLILFGWNVVQVLAAVCVGTAWGAGRAGAEWAMVTDGYLAEAENASLALASRIPGYVAVNGQTLPVTTRERERRETRRRRRWSPPRARISRERRTMGRCRWRRIRRRRRRRRENRRRRRRQRRRRAAAEEAKDQNDDDERDWRSR